MLYNVLIEDHGTDMTPKTFTALKNSPKVTYISYETANSKLAQIKEQLGEVQICNGDHCLPLKRSA